MDIRHWWGGGQRRHCLIRDSRAESTLWLLLTLMTSCSIQGYEGEGETEGMILLKVVLSASVCLSLGVCLGVGG